MGAIVELNTGEFGEIIRWDHGKQMWYIITEDDREVFTTSEGIKATVSEAAD